MGEMTGRDDSGLDRQAFVNSVSPENLAPLLSNLLPTIGWANEHHIRAFGWLDGGVSAINGASGLITEAPTPNRFSNQVMLDAAWLAVERPTGEGFSWGFRMDFFTGSDTALLRSLNHFGPIGPRWGTDFRQAYFSFHTPLLFRKGIDWTAGRINFPTGVETVMAPYQQIYSRGYFWIHGATSGTALFATAHVNSQLDVVAGSTMGYGTSFILRGRAPDYLVRVLYHPARRLKQQLVATVYMGPKPLSTVAGHAGTWQALVELQAREVWTERFSQIYQVSYIADVGDPANRGRASATQGALVLSTYRLDRNTALNLRLEWFSDPSGARTAVPGTYSEATVGVTFYPKRWWELRPEIRGDFSGQDSFGPADSRVRHRDQLSVGVEVLLKGRLF